MVTWNNQMVDLKFGVSGLSSGTYQNTCPAKVFEHHPHLLGKPYPERDQLFFLLTTYPCPFLQKHISLFSLLCGTILPTSTVIDHVGCKCGDKPQYVSPGSPWTLQPMCARVKLGHGMSWGPWTHGHQWESVIWRPIIGLRIVPSSWEFIDTIKLDHVPSWLVQRTARSWTISRGGTVKRAAQSEGLVFVLYMDTRGDIFI